MLILTRQEGERLVIELAGRTVTITVARVTSAGIGTVKLGTEAPPEISISRVDPAPPASETPRSTAADPPVDEVQRTPREAKGQAIKGADGTLRLKRSSGDDA